MPIRTEPSLSPGLRTHSCSAVYFRSSGYKASPHRSAVGAGYCCGTGAWLLGGLGAGELGARRVDDALDVDRLELHHLDRGAVVLELRPGAAGEDHAADEGAGLADDVDDVRRGEQRVADVDAAHAVLEAGLGDDPHLAVDLHRLG